MKHLRNHPLSTSSSTDRPFKYISKFTKNGKIYFYFQRKKTDKKEYFQSSPGTVEFLLEYNKFSGVDVKKKEKIDRTIASLILSYQASNDYVDLKASTKKDKQSIFAWIMDNAPNGDIRTMTPAHVEALMQLKDGAGAGNKVKKQLSLLFKHAQKINWVPIGFNPAMLATRRKHEVKGFHTWTPEEIAAYEAAHPSGTEARLALYLFMVTGASKADGLLLGWKDVKDGKIFFNRLKTGQGKSVRIPQFLMSELERIPPQQETFIATSQGKPRSPNGFGNTFKRFVTQAGIPHCTTHGLRKAMAVKLAEGGMSKHVIGAWLAHNGTDQVDVYTKDRDREALVDEAMEFLNWK